MTPRLHDWQQRLAAVIAERFAAPFAYGGNHCASFAAACVHACTGRQLLTEAEAACASSVQADRMIASGGGLAAMVTQRLGPSVPVQLAAVGDVGIFDEGERQALAVQVGGAWMAPGERGLRVVQPDLVRCAWRCEGG